MMLQLRSFVFVSLVAAAGCGSDRVASAPTPTEVVVTKVPAPVAPPVVDMTPVDQKTPPVVAPAPVQEVVGTDPFVMPTTYADCMKVGVELAAKGEHARAREVLTQAAKLDRKRAEPQIELARSYIVTEDKALAVRAATKATKLAPDSSQAWNTMGRAELLRHAYDAAVTAFTRAIELDDGNIWAWNNLGYTHLQRREYEQAIVALVEATRSPKAAGYMFNNLGTAYEQLDRLDEARDAFEAGGKLGSGAALASRKRLEGVDSVAITTYDVNDSMPEEPVEPSEEPDDPEEPVAPETPDAGVPIT